MVIVAGNVYLYKFLVDGLKKSEQALLLCARSACAITDNA